MIFRSPVHDKLPSPQQFAGTAQKRSRTPDCAKARQVTRLPLFGRCHDITTETSQANHDS
jgi:hypothetical protein